MRHRVLVASATVILRLRILLVALVVAVVCAGCRVDMSTEVSLRPDGSGTVTVVVAMDADAVSALGGVDKLRTADLVAAGWEVASPVPAAEGGSGITMTASKSFLDDAQLSAVLAEITGVAGVYGDPSFGRSRTTFREHYDFSASLDLTQGLAALDDPGLVTLLEANGADVAALRATAAAIPASVGISLSVELPGGASRTWNAQPGQVVAAELSSSTVRSGQIGKIAAAAVLAGLAVLVAVVAVGSAMGRRRRAWRDGFPTGRGRGALLDAPDDWLDDWSAPDGDGSGRPPGSPGSAGVVPGIAPEVVVHIAEARPVDLPPPPPDWDPFGSEPDPRRG